MITLDKNLNEVVSLSRALKIQDGDIIQFVGGGGKTSLIGYLANEVLTTYPNFNCAIITSTKKGIPADASFMLRENKLLDLDNIDKHLIEVGVVYNSHKYGWLGDDNYFALKKWANVIFIEADGSRQKPIKACADYEPVYLDDATKTMIVMGLSAYGKDIEAVCHRYELFIQDLESLAKDTKEKIERDRCVLLKNSNSVTKEIYLHLLNTYYLSENLQNSFVILNQADDDKRQKVGAEILSKVDRPGFLTSLDLNERL